MELVIIGGCPRSGTTLIQNILDCHTDCYSPPETGLVHAFVNFRTDLSNASHRAKRVDVTGDSVINNDIRCLFSEITKRFCQDVSAKYFIEKTPSNAIVMSDALKLFEGAKGIGIVRHPGAIANSCSRVRERFKSDGLLPPRRISSVNEVALMIVEHFVGLQKAWVGKNERYILLRYEDLCSNPAESVKEICAFIGIDYQSEMLLPHLKDHENHALLSPSNHWYTEQELLRSIDPGRSEAWREEIDAGEYKKLIPKIATIEPFLAELGYFF